MLDFGVSFDEEDGSVTGATELEQHKECVHKSVQDDIRLVLLNPHHELMTNDRCERLSSRRPQTHAGLFSCIQEACQP